MNFGQGKKTISTTALFFACWGAVEAVRVCYDWKVYFLGVRMLAVFHATSIFPMTILERDRSLSRDLLSLQNMIVILTKPLIKTC